MKQNTLRHTRPVRIIHTIPRTGESVPIYYDPSAAKAWRRGKPRKLARAQLRAQQRWWERYFGEVAEAETDRLHQDASGGFVVDARQRPVDIDEGLDWIEQLVIPTGPSQGSNMWLMDWQKEWIREALEPGIRIAGLSVSRKNSKTMMNGAIAACHLAGPWHRPNWAGIVCADKADNAHVFLRQLKELAGASGLMNDLDFKATPYPGRVLGPDGSELRVLAADRHGTGHASNADIVWIDECGGLRAADRPMYQALLSAISARDGKFFAVGNQREGEMFREMEAQADLPHVHWKRYTTPRECEITDEESWYLGNPGLGTIKPLSYMREMLQGALATPANMSYFRSFDLNQAIDPSRQLIVQEGDWIAVESADARILRERVAVGIDMGGTESMSAFACIGLESGVLEVWAAWGGGRDLLERGRRDGVDTLYLDMADRGELRIYETRIVPGGQFIWDRMQELVERECAVVAVGADRKWREEMTLALRDGGYRGPVEWRGTGGGQSWMHGAADVRAFQRLVLDREIAAPPSLLLRNAIISSTLDINVRGNPSLDKGNNRNSRIDALQAAVIAAGLYERLRAEEREIVVVGD